MLEAGLKGNRRSPFHEEGAFGEERRPIMAVASPSQLGR